MCQSFYSFICFEGMGGPVTLVELNKQHCSSTSTRCFGSTISYHKKLTCNRSTREDEAFFFLPSFQCQIWDCISVFYSLLFYKKSGQFTLVEWSNQHYSIASTNMYCPQPNGCNPLGTQAKNRSILCCEHEVQNIMLIQSMSAKALPVKKAFSAFT